MYSRKSAGAAAAVCGSAPTTRLVFDPETRKMHVDKEHCVGCGRCVGACNFDAIDC